MVVWEQHNNVSGNDDYDDDDDDYVVVVDDESNKCNLHADCVLRSINWIYY